MLFEAPILNVGKSLNMWVPHTLSAAFEWFKTMVDMNEQVISSSEEVSYENLDIGMHYL